MSWEDQGRQWHGWFGTGTGGGPEAGDAALGIVREAAGLVPAARRGAFGRYLADGGAGELREAIPIWAGASGLEGRAFRRLVVGPVLGAEAAGSLRAMGAAFAAGDYGAAAARLAEAVGSEPSGRWAGGLGWARDQAVYSAVNGTAPGETQGAGLRAPRPVKDLVVDDGAKDAGADVDGENRIKNDVQASGGLLGELRASSHSVQGALPVAVRTSKWQECHERCMSRYIGRGYGSDYPLLYARCMWDCGAFK